jgi:glycerol-3-phosphate dehydrogenase
MLERVRAREKSWDFIIIGGGATGVGCALDAAARGFDVLLLEQSDFGKGTSGKSTKLVHGGVRYLAQGNVSLVREALKERGILFKNAPHLVRRTAFIVPCYTIFDKIFYGAGLKIYDLLAGKYNFGRSRILSKRETLEKLPNLRPEKLRGGVVYFDGQFDDTRLLINLAQTAASEGASLLNYARVAAVTKNELGKIDGVEFADAQTGELFRAKAKIVVNAAGAFCDAVRRLSVAGSKNIIAPSQGVHLVFDREFLPSENALMIPKTPDKRVLFVIPWHDKILVGTTDTPIEKADLEPKPLAEEIEFILQTAGDYLAKAPQRKDVLSVFAGVRPLVKSENADNTAALSRDHTIEIDEADLLTVTGGKWTTYRRMAEDAVDQAIKTARLEEKMCPTENLKIYDASEKNLQKLIEENPGLGEKIHPDLPYRKAEIVRAVRDEMARTLEDVLARRTRALFLDARAAIEIGPPVARLMAAELGENEDWIKAQIAAFDQTAENYLI